MKKVKNISQKEEIKKYEIIASFDIHTKRHYLYSVNVNTGELLADKYISSERKCVLKALKKLGKKAQILVLIEAGNQGFAPYRMFEKNGYKCLIIAPTSIPKRGNEQKTDRNNAINNLEYCSSGLLGYVDVPQEIDEDAREANRYRLNKVMEISKHKQKILALVKRTGQEFSLTKSNWTKKHRDWLKRIELPASTRLVLDCRIADLEKAEDDLRQLDQQLDTLMETTPRYKRITDIYKLLPGIGRVNAMTLLLEGRDLRRFKTAGAFMNFTGLIPKKHASSDVDPSLHITKAGNKYLRTAIVGAAKHYRDTRYTLGRKVLDSLPKGLQPFIDKLQSRLFGRYRYLRSKGKHSNKARVAVARELCGFLWELMNKQVPQLPQMALAV